MSQQRCPGPRGGLFVLSGHRDMPRICGGRQNIGKLPKTEGGLSNVSNNPIAMMLLMSEYIGIDIVKVQSQGTMFQIRIFDWDRKFMGKV